MTFPAPEATGDGLRNWIYEQWGAVHCYHQTIDDYAWQGYKASLTWGGASFNPKIWTDLSAMIAAGDQFVGCGVPAPDLQTYFDNRAKECQCAEIMGQLFVRYRTPSGEWITSEQSATGFAKDIIQYRTVDGETSCQWNDTAGLFHIQILNEPLYPGSAGYWYIVPVEGTGCCEGENNFPIRPPQPADIYQEIEYQPYGTGSLTIELRDAAVDHWDICWKKWRARHVYYNSGCDYYPCDSEVFWWESVDGPLIHKFDDRNPFLEHPHRLKGCYGNHNIAPDVKPILEGSWVTTRWISDQKMDHSGRRLRKLFRYRSKGGRFLPELTAWWTNFQWEAGDTCVIHKGAWWGTPQIWTKDAEEGKRVIRFAGSEAGIDPDKDGEWIVTSSSAPRYGMSGTMRVHMKEGFPWVAQRPGPNFPNLLAQPVDP